MSRPPQKPRALGQAACRVLARPLDRSPAPELLPLPLAFSPLPSLTKRRQELTAQENLHILRFGNQTDNSHSREFHGEESCPQRDLASSSNEQYVRFRNRCV